LAGPTGKIFEIRDWALALARLSRLQLRRFLGHLLFERTQQGFPACRTLLPLPLTIAP
jgi:hypothetical protein